MVKILAMIIPIIMFFSGCSKEMSKVDIPKNMEATKLADILKRPTNYHEKKVLLEGVVAFASSCHIVYQEGVDSIEIYLAGSECPVLKKGQRVKVYAEIVTGKERIVISPIKLEVVK